MRTQPNAAQDRAFAVIPPAAPQTPWRVEAVAPIGERVLRVRFLDGLEGEVDMTNLIGSVSAGVFAALSDPALFRQVRVERGAVTWPGELDLAPDAMHRAIAATGRWAL